MSSHVGFDNSPKNFRNIPTICLDGHSDSMTDGGHGGLQEIGSRFFEEGSTTNIPHFLSWLSCLGAYKKYVVTCVLLSRCEPCFRTGARIVNGWSPSTCISGVAVDYAKRSRHLTFTLVKMNVFFLSRNCSMCNQLQYGQHQCNYLNSVNVSRTSDSMKIIDKLLELLSHFSTPNLSPVEKNSFRDYLSDSVTSQNSSVTPFVNCTDDEISKAFDIKQRYIQLTLELIAMPSSFSDLLNELSNRETEIHECELREAVVQLPITCLILSLLLHPSFNHEERTSLLTDIRAYIKSASHGLLSEDKDIPLPFLEGLSTNILETYQHSVSTSIKTALYCKILGCIMELATDTWYVLQYFQNGPMCLATSLPHSLTSSGFLSGSGDGESGSQYDLLSEAATVNTTGGYSGSSMNGGSHYGALLTVPHPLSMDSRHSFSGCTTTNSLAIGNTCDRRQFSSTTTPIEENTARLDSLPCALRKHGTFVTSDTRTCDVSATNLVATAKPCDGEGDIPAHRLSSSVCPLPSSLEKRRNKYCLSQLSPIDGMTVSSAKVGTAGRFLYAAGRTQMPGSNQTIGIESANKVTYLDPTSGMMGVPAWLKSLRLHKYAGLFQHLAYTEFMNIDEAWLEHQNVTRGARNKLLLSIHRLASRGASLSLAESLLTQSGSTATIAGVQALHACLSEVGAILQTPLKPCSCVAPPAPESTGKRPTGIPPIVFSTKDEADASTTRLDEADHLSESVERFPPDLVGAAADKAETGTECLPCRIIGCLSKVCSRLLVNPQLDTECCNRFMHILDVIGTHQAFLDKHKSLTISWLRSMFAGRNIWLERDTYSGGGSCILSSLHPGNTSTSHLPTTAPPKGARPIYRTSGAHESKDYSPLMMTGRSHQLAFSDPKAPGACFNHYPGDSLSPSLPAGPTSCCFSAGECTHRRHSVPLNQTGKQSGQSTKPRCLRRMPSPGASITPVGLDQFLPSSPSWNRSSSPSSYLLSVCYPLSPPPRRRPPAILLTRSSLDVSTAAVRPETVSASSMPPLGSPGGPLLPQPVVGQHFPRHGSGSSPTGCRPVLFPPATAPPTRMPSPSSDAERWRYRQQLQLAAAQTPTGWSAVPDWHSLSPHCLQHNCRSPAAGLASRYEEEEVVTAVRLARDGHQLLTSDCSQTAAEKNSLPDCMLPIRQGHSAGSVASQVDREVGSLNPPENATAATLWLTNAKVDFPGHPLPTLSRSTGCTEHIEHDLDVLTREVTELAIGDLDSPVG